MKKAILLLTAVLLIFVAACGTANDTPAGNTNENDLAGAQDIGQGSTVFNFQAFDGDGNVTSWNVHTNETSVGAALVATGLISGDVSDFGLMVTHVNGIRADFVEDGAWWALYIDDEMAMVGVDDVEIEDGVIYKFIYTPA